MGKGCCSEFACAFHYVKKKFQKEDILFHKEIWYFQSELYDILNKTKSKKGDNVFLNLFPSFPSI